LVDERRRFRDLAGSTQGLAFWGIWLIQTLFQEIRIHLRSNISCGVGLFLYQHWGDCWRAVLQQIWIVIIAQLRLDPVAANVFAEMPKPQQAVLNDKACKLNELFDLIFQSPHIVRLYRL
jgi:hypothetical protein